MVVIDEEYITNLVDRKVRECEDRMRREFAETVKNEVEAKLAEAKSVENQILEGKIAGAIQALTTIVNNKDITINRLIEDIGALKTSLNHVSQDTQDLEDNYNKQQGQIKERQGEIKMLEDKAASLEDQSRRHNMLFFNVPEQEKGWEDCEEKVLDIIDRNKMFGEEDTLPSLDRAHRLGKKGDERKAPRPIIVKFTSYKDKEYVMNNKTKLEGKPIFINEDYSKNTVDIHKKLLAKAKAAKEENKMIEKYFLNYKSITLTYKIEGRETLFKKTYQPKDMITGAWHVLSNQS